MTRVATALGAKAVLPTVMQVTPSLVREQDWRRRRTAFVALAQTAHGLRKPMYRHLLDTTDLALAFFEDPNPLVRYAAVHLVGRLALDFADEDACGDDKPTYQRLAGAKVLPALSKKLRAAFESEWRVRVHACSAMINFFVEYGDVPPEEHAPFLRDALDGLVEHVNTGPMAAVKEAIACISAIATVASEASFAPFYELVLPMVMRTLHRDDFKSDPDVSALRGRVVECVGIMASAATPDAFRRHAEQTLALVMEALRQTDDGMVRRYAMSALPRLAAAGNGAGADGVVALLPHVMPGIISAASADVGVVMLSPNDTEEVQRELAAGKEFLQVHIRGEGTRIVGVNTTAMQDLGMAVLAIHNLADALGVRFAAYAPACAQAIVKLADYEFNPQVRDVALLALPKLVQCMRETPDVAQALFFDTLAVLVSTVKAGVEAVGESVATSDAASGAAVAGAAAASAEEEGAAGGAADEAGEDSEEAETTRYAAEALVALVRFAYESGGAYDNDAYGEHRADGDCPPRIFVPVDKFADVLTELTELLKGVAEDMLLSRRKLELALQQGEVDQEVADSFKSGRDALRGEVLIRVVDTIGYIVKGKGKSAFPAVKECGLLRVLVSLASRGAPDEFRHAAVCLLDDLIEFCGGGTDAETERACFDLCLELCSGSENPRLARAAVWGLGICAQRGALAGEFDARAGDVASALHASVRKWRGVRDKAVAVLQAAEQAAATAAGPEDGPDQEVVDEAEEAAFAAGLVADNALSALEKMVRFRSDALGKRGVNPEAVLKEVVQALPCTDDAEEARCVNAVMLGLYVPRGAAVASPEYWFEVLVPQLGMGFDANEAGVGAWDDEDGSFMVDRTRRVLAAALKEGLVRRPATPDVMARVGGEEVWGPALAALVREYV